MGDLVTLAMPIADLWLGWFVETTLVASALAAMAALAARVPRLAPSPAARHALWLMVLLKLVTPPLVHWPWSVPSPVTTTRHDSIRSGNVSVTIPSKPDPHVISRLDRSPVAALPGSPDHEIPSMAATSVLEGEVVAVSHLGTFQATLPLPGSPGVWIFLAWLVGSIAIGLGQARSIFRFRRLLLEATPAPSWLVEEAELIGRHVSVRVPTILVVPRLGTPVLWCLGRPVLLVPAKLLQTLEAGSWGAILAHELAHLRRGDHWVRRIELAAGLAWWWNPLYWLARHRLDFEAELACDAWAVWASPRDRLSYAESLLRICTTLSSAGSPTPALGIIGTGRSFERRLTMILRDRVDRRVSAPSLLAASLLAALALPSWTLAEVPAVGEIQVDVTAPVAVPTSIEVREPAPRVVVVALKTDDDDDDASATEKETQKADKLKAERDELQKKMKALGKEMETKFGPGSEFAKEIEKEFGPDSNFAKQMEAFGKEMEAKFGPGSEFAKKMESMGKDIEIKFGPDSEFAKDMKERFAKDGSKDLDKVEAKKAKVRVEIKAKAETDRAKADAARVNKDLKVVEDNALRAKLNAETKVKAEARAKASNAERRARRIESLESRMEEMMNEVKKLKAESDTVDKAEKD